MVSDVDKMPETLKTDFKNLAKLAYNGLLHDNLVFSYDEILSVVPDDDDDDADIEQHLLGLMTATKSSSSTGCEVTYQFLHLTIQEYLAAKWATVEILPEQQVEFMKQHLSNDRLRMMLLFLAGITQPGSGDLFSGESLSFRDTEYDDLQMQRRFLFLCHITYEAQSSSLCHFLSNTIKDKTISLSGLTLFDYRVLGYFLAHSDCHFKCLKISGNISNQDLVSLKQGILIEERSGSVKVGCVDFSAAKFNHKAVSSILQTVPFLKDCEILLINIDVEGDSTVVDCFNDRYKDVSNLFIKMPIQIQVTVKGEIITSRLFDMIDHTFPADEALTAISEVPNLRILVLEELQVPISKDKYTCIYRIIRMVERLTALRVRHCNDFDILMNCVVVSLMHTTSLVELEISDNCISNLASDETYLKLFRAIKGNGTLKKLDVSRWNRSVIHSGVAHRQAIRMELLKAIYEILSCNNTLEELYLCGWVLIGPDRYRVQENLGPQELN